MVSSKVPPNINSVPYSAPLSFPEPSKEWRDAQSWKNMRKETLYVPDVDLTGKWIIISGSNSGIGREAALAFARMGANLVLACREIVPDHEPHPSAVVEECRALAVEHGHEKSRIEAWGIDLANLASVEAFAEKWLETGRALDILCNNAGIGSSGSGEKVVKTRDGFEIFHQVNFLAHVLLTLKLLPALAKAEMPRVVCTVSSQLYHGEFDIGNFNGELNRPGKDGVQFYNNNKLWFQTWLTELQRRLLQHKEYRHITINGVHPGFVNSEIWNLEFDSWTGPLKVALYRTMAHFFAIDSQQGSLCILHGAISVIAGPDPDIQGVGIEGGKGGGRYFSRTREEEPMPHTRDPDCMNRVWRKVNEELGLAKKGLLDVVGVDRVEDS
ncbi:hypothetical protein FKW77_006337 [Venturia effusa]|uniref:NAD(P)-binding protein n=1 Tax=Venturia effusa TaxID=50376 RepID=A0A517LJ57_9PEZI|nr:hypothetical protein FKW77_006337 [Venturia effusa]